MVNWIKLSKWFENVQEITDKAQHLAWKPSNTIFDLFSTSQSTLGSNS